MRWGRVVVLVAVVAAACQPTPLPPDFTVPTTTTSSTTTTLPSEPAGPRPDVLVVKLDDLSIDAMSHYMPRTSAVVQGEHWYDFTQAVVPTPLCGPERSSFLTGQQVDHHGLTCHVNGVTCPIWKQLRPRLLPKALADTGVWVGWYGKLVNWTGECGGEKAANGWPSLPGVTDSHVLFGDAQTMYDKYSLIENGVLVKHDVAIGGPDEYGTYYTASLVEDAIDACASPCALFWNPQAPHQPGTPPPDYDPAAVVPGMVPYQPPYNEGCAGAVDPSIADKPSLLQTDSTCVPSVWRRTLDQEALQGVDNRLPAMIEQFLARPGAKRIVITSDHGKQQGNHRHTGKETPYEMDVRVPLYIYDSGQPGGVVDQLVNTRDLSATVLDWLDAEPLITPTDSRSLVPRYAEAATGDADTYISHLRVQEGVFDIRPWRAVRQDCVRAAQETRHCLKVVRYPASKVLKPDGSTVTLPEEREVYVLDEDPWELTNVLANPVTGYSGLTGWGLSHPQVAAAFASLAAHEAAGS